MSLMCIISFDKMNWCSHSLSELESMWPRVVALDVEEQAEYADSICVGSADDEEFCRSQLSSMQETFPTTLPSNTTGVGNLAYLSLHAHTTYRDQFKLTHLAYMTILKLEHNLDDASSPGVQN